MPIPNPDHLFDQAERLVAAQGGAPRQADLRRAVSSAYYGVFHSVLTAAADQCVGASRRKSAEYALAYRHIEHAALRRLCEDACKPTLPKSYGNFVGINFSADLRAFANAVVVLQAHRHEADYDPLLTLRASDVRASVATARAAATRFWRLASDEKLTFLTLLLFKLR